MMTDESVVEWATGWLATNPTGDPTFRQRFIDGLTAELQARAEERAALVKTLDKVREARRAWVNAEWGDEAAESDFDAALREAL